MNTPTAEAIALGKFIDANGLTFESNGELMPPDRQPDDVRAAMRDLEDETGSWIPGDWA